MNFNNKDAKVVKDDYVLSSDEMNELLLRTAGNIKVGENSREGYKKVLEIDKDNLNEILNIDIGNCDMKYESGKLIIPKSDELDQIDKAHQEWFGIRDK